MICLRRVHIIINNILRNVYAKKKDWETSNKHVLLKNLQGIYLQAISYKVTQTI